MPAFFDFDDLLPEEQDEQLSKLLSLFSLPEEKVEAMPMEEEQNQILSRVRQRLQQIEQTAHQPMPSLADEQVSDSEPVWLSVGERDQNRLQNKESGHNRLQGKENKSGTFMSPFTPLRRRAQHNRTRDWQPLISSIAAVLLVGVLVSGLIFLAMGHSMSGGATTGTASTSHKVSAGTVSASQNASASTTERPAGPVGNMINIHSSANGLDASFEITPGPYFLSELLEVNMTLTNHSQKAVQIDGGSCGSGPLWIDQSDGSAPKYQLPLLQIAMPCPFPMPVNLVPGRTITTQEYIVLTGSGAVTLTENARFDTTQTQIVNGQKETTTTSGKSPLDGHWPSLHINVAPQIPSDRVIFLQANGASVTVTGPKDALPHLLYRYTFSCSRGNNNGANLQWSMTQPALHAPGCVLTEGTWTYAVSAPGYAVASGRFGR